MKNIIVATLIIGFGFGTIKTINKVTSNKLNKVTIKLNNAKNSYWDCLEFSDGCNGCEIEYDKLKIAYDNFNKVKFNK
tara:strand:- start:85 stop:318 length:234 start_codon:yes stop_codon:yes gene_type:complete